MHPCPLPSIPPASPQQERCMPADADWDEQTQQRSRAHTNRGPHLPMSPSHGRHLPISSRAACISIMNIQRRTAPACKLAAHALINDCINGNRQQVASAGPFLKATAPRPGILANIATAPLEHRLISSDADCCRAPYSARDAMLQWEPTSATGHTTW